MTTTLTVTSKGQVPLGSHPGQRLEAEVLPDGRLELHAARASLEEIAEAAAAGWAGQ